MFVTPHPAEKKWTRSYLAAYIAVAIAAAVMTFFLFGRTAFIFQKNISAFYFSTIHSSFSCTCANTLFSLRFWIQWIMVEQRQKSQLTLSFWWISLIGSIFFVLHFFLMRTWLYSMPFIIETLFSIRNIVLIKQNMKTMSYEKSYVRLASGPPPVPHFVFIAGEVSGDEIAAKIIQQLKKLFPDALFSGVCGPKMREQNVFPWFAVEQFQVMGLFDVIKKLPFLIRALKKLTMHIWHSNVDMVVTIDQPSFSVRLAATICRLKKPGFKKPYLIQIVAPSVWAYKPQRVTKIKKVFDAIFVLYKFEVDYFRNALPTLWIGHPALESNLGSFMQKEPRELRQDEKTQIHNERVSTAAGQKIIVLYPGSRPKEIERNLAFQLKIVEAAYNDYNAQYCQTLDLQKTTSLFSIFVQLAATVSEQEIALIMTAIQSSSLSSSITLAKYDERFLLMRRACFALAKSGTVTLELALMKVSHIVCYRLSTLTYLWAQYVLGVNPKQKFALPNILLQKEVIPEFITATPKVEDMARILSRHIFFSKPMITDEEKNTLLEQIVPIQHLSPSQYAAINIAHILNTKTIDFIVPHLEKNL